MTIKILRMVAEWAVVESGEARDSNNHELAVALADLVNIINRVLRLMR